MSSHLAPLVGAVVWAWLPEVETPDQPGPKLRPVVVLDVTSNGGLIVAKGTSNTQYRYRGEFVIESHEMRGLQKPTKFSLGNAMTIPAKSEFFMWKDRLQVVGPLKGLLMERLREAAEELGWL